MFRYFPAFHAFDPPDVEDFTVLFVPNEVAVVGTRKTPLVGLPLGSTLAKQNSMFESLAKPANALGVLATSALSLRKS